MQAPTPPPDGGSAAETLAALVRLVQQPSQPPPQQQQPVQQQAAEPPFGSIFLQQLVEQHRAQQQAAAAAALPPPPAQLQQQLQALPPVSLPLPALPLPQLPALMEGTATTTGAFKPAPPLGEPFHHPGDAVPTSRKVRVTCNDVPGVLHLDDLYVACCCPQCEARVALGHGRPIFGLSRFERHCGSKAKKWRISLRVEPGSCPEVRRSDPPMPVGVLLDMRGIAVKGSGEREGYEGEQAPGFGGAAAAPSKRSRLQGWGPTQAPPGAGAEGGDSPAQQEGGGWELQLLGEPGPGSAVTEAFLREQAAAFGEAPRPAAAAAPPPTREQQHAAIFRLVLALLEGPSQRLFSEAFMPWLNELPEDQLARQHCTLACYLGLLREGMPWRAVHRQLLAYLRGTLRRILARRGGGAAAGQPEAAGASPVTTPSGAPSGEGDPPHHLPASGSEPSLHAAAGAAGAAAAGVTGDSGTPRGPGSGKPGSGGKLPATT